MNSDPSASSQAPAVTAGFSSPKSTLLGDIVAKLLGLISTILSPGMLENSLSFSKRIGHYTVLAGAAFTVIYGLIMAVKLEAFQLLITALLFVGVIAVAQFAAVRFLDAAGKIIANTPSRVSSPAFFECTGLIVIILAIGMLFSGFTAAIYMRSFPALVPFLVGALFMLAYATVMLHPRIVNVNVGEGSAGEEAIGILTTLMKTNLILAPLVFFLLSVLGALIVLAGFFGDRFAASFAMFLQYMPLPTDGLPFGFVGATLIIAACLVPILVYFVFLLQYLFLDVIRAILAVPGKLDALRR
ncbi:MAG TPA: hypothetical protein VMM36_14625 [Opitutaceae bacterium]|nr:hypothetical protein [Opitutaceae bacterium]